MQSAGGSSEPERREGRVGLFVHLFRRFGPRRLRATFLSGTQTYDLAGRQVQEGQLNISSPFALGRWLEASFNRDHLTRTSRVDLQLVLEDPRVHSATTMNRQQIGTVVTQRVTQSVRGAVGYDSRSHNLMLSDRPWTGQSAVAMRFFLDRNGNGRFDDGEEPIPDPNRYKPIDVPFFVAGWWKATWYGAWCRGSSGRRPENPSPAPRC